MPIEYPFIRPNDSHAVKMLKTALCEIAILAGVAGVFAGSMSLGGLVLSNNKGIYPELASDKGAALGAINGSFMYSLAGLLRIAIQIIRPNTNDLDSTFGEETLRGFIYKNRYRNIATLLICDYYPLTYSVTGPIAASLFNIDNNAQVLAAQTLGLSVTAPSLLVLGLILKAAYYCFASCIQEYIANQQRTARMREENNAPTAQEALRIVVNAQAAAVQVTEETFPQPQERVQQVSPSYSALFQPASNDANNVQHQYPSEPTNTSSDARLAF